MKNYDAKEISHFAELANHWWDPKGPLRTLHDINPVRMEFILKHAELQHKKVVDGGCGGGILSEALAKGGALVTGVDLESHAIQVASRHAKENALAIQYHCVPVETLVEESERYDVITCMEMLEHVPDPESIIKSCVALLNPGGKLFLSTINKTWKAYLLVILGAEYVLNLIPKNTHQYDRFIRPSQIVEWVRGNNLSVQALAGLDYNPCSHHASLTGDLEMNYLVLAS